MYQLLGRFPQLFGFCIENFGHSIRRDQCLAMHREQRIASMRLEINFFDNITQFLRQGLIGSFRLC